MNSENTETRMSNATTEQRMAELARSKARLELVNRQLISLSAVSGLENLLPNILDILMQTVGAANITIIFRLNDTWLLRDVYGISRELVELDDHDVLAVLESGKPLRLRDAGQAVPYPGLADPIVVENWIFPLMSRDRKIGVVRMDGMQLTHGNIFDELQPFFVYAGLMLDNELSNYSQLAEAHRRLQDSENLYRTLFEQSPEGIVLWRAAELTPVQFNSAAHRMLGYSRQEFSTLRLGDIEGALSAEEVSTNVSLIKMNGIIDFETILRTKTGEDKSVAVKCKLLDIGGESVILANHRDITELKKAEELLKISEENYRAFTGLTSDYVHKCYRSGDEPFRLLWIGGSVESITGYRIDEIIEKGCWLSLVHPDDRPMVASHLMGLVPGDLKQIEFRLITKNGENRWILETVRCEASKTDGGLVLFGSSTDITERKRAEEERSMLEQQLLHTQKLESLGVLAGGIAHDFNNILMAIIGNADLALMRINKESPAVENLNQIESAAARAADLAKQMLAYSGKGRFLIETLDLNVLLNEMLHMLQVSISKKALLRLNLNQHLPPVEADATQLRQIVMNLVINASEAIGDRSGVIAIATGCMECDQNYLKNAWLDEKLADGLYVFLEISDTGCGMDKDTLGKIFDPFFTTKFTGRGLGMAAVLGIVRGHHGAIKIYSEQGKGTTFKILLPASGRPAELFNLDSRADGWRGSGTVLLVDDEESVRGIGSAMLKELGFAVVTANDGREALELFRIVPDIRVVILDLTMPRMDGEQCFRELRQQKPDVKVIISSGYNEQEVTQRFVGKGLAGFVQKPYRLSVLKDALKAVL